ncbi:hypothetical protein ACJX0J_034745, partial [Zea mays]
RSLLNVQNLIWTIGMKLHEHYTLYFHNNAAKGATSQSKFLFHSPSKQEQELPSKNKLIDATPEYFHGIFVSYEYKTRKLLNSENLHTSIFFHPTNLYKYNFCAELQIPEDTQALTEQWIVRTF